MTPTLPDTDRVTAVAALVPGAQIDPDTPWMFQTPDGLTWGIADDSDPLLTEGSWVVTDPDGTRELCSGSARPYTVYERVAARQADRAAREVLTAHGIDIAAGADHVYITAPPAAPIDPPFGLVLDPDRRVALTGAVPCAPGTWRLPKNGKCQIGVRVGDAPQAAVVQAIDTAGRHPGRIAQILRAAVADALTYGTDPAAVDARIAAAGLDVGLTAGKDAITVTAPAPHGKFAWGGHCGNRVLVGPGHRISLGHLADRDATPDGVYRLAEDPAGISVNRWDDVEFPIEGFDDDAPYCEVEWIEPQAAHHAALPAHVERFRLVLALALAHVDRVPPSLEGQESVAAEGAERDAEDARIRAAGDPPRTVVTHQRERLDLVISLRGGPHVPGIHERDRSPVVMLARSVVASYVKDGVWSTWEQDGDATIMGPPLLPSGEPDFQDLVKVTIDPDNPEHAWAAKIAQDHTPKP